MTGRERGARPVRIGVLGAARIVHEALVKPAGEIDGVVVAAVAARDRGRAEQFATKHGIARVHGSYEALLADPDLDAVYVPLPAALHAPWTIAAVEVGKHVLCEKPFTSNAADAEAVAAVAAASDLVVMEAYHSHYHPLYGRLREILASGELGTIRRADASFCVPIRPGGDIRWNLALGGGGLLDVGYYPVRALTELFGEPVAVPEAQAWLRDGVDRRLDARLALPSGVDGRIVSSMWSRKAFAMGLEVRGDVGRMRVSFPHHPQMGTRIRIDGRNGRRVERAERRSTYSYQLEAFRGAASGAQAPATDAAAAVRNMRTLDAIYAAAGMQPRPGWTG